MHVAICVIVFGAHMNLLFIIKVKILVLMKWSYKSPGLCGQLSVDLIRMT